MLVVQEYIRDEQEPAFYYHSDFCGNREPSRACLNYAETEQSVRSKHLGSAAYLTNNGQVTQTLNHLPYGEDWIDIQHYMGARYSNMELYTFTGKEKDYETSYGYFEARYMDHELMTMWLSVDPMADKYPGISPYAYCSWNPIKLVDPDGRLIDDYFSQDGKYLGSDNASTHSIRIITEHNWSILPKDENGVVSDNQLGHDLSYSFSDASSNGIMNEKAQLKVYQHYNPTKKTFTNNINGEGPGMTTVVSKNKQGSTCIRLMIKLKPNYTKDKDGWTLCDNADEITNSFIPERNHIDRARAMGYEKWSKLNRSNPYDIEESAVNAQKAMNLGLAVVPNFE